LENDGFRSGLCVVLMVGVNSRDWRENLCGVVSLCFARESTRVMAQTGVLKRAARWARGLTEERFSAIRNRLSWANEVAAFEQP